ncbi:MAG TPA: sigma-70 family RNA polymerase sigma factor [Silvibacterium sp.]|jgi:RNA polymerase sigma-70 factor (ECF subfamily)|nr:sigma-70 family RNA polymerase sigma factor [Silvibacterium sp.]
MSDLEGAQSSTVKIVATCQMKQQATDVQRDVYDSHRHRVFSLAFYMTGNELEAEEILTRTFVRAFRAVDEPQSQHVDAALIQELCQRFPLDQNEPSASFRSELSAGSNLGGQNVRRTDLEEAIQMLPAMKRLLFLLHDVEGYSPTAISQLIEVPESQVRATLFSARIQLRHELATARADHREAA